MATLNLKSLNTLVSNQAATIQANSTALIDFTVGAVLRAVVEANAAVAMWLQGMILTVLAVTRLATSNGSDVDSFVNDFGLYRMSSSASAGLVTFSRYTPTLSALIPIGAQVQSADGTQNFVVVANASNSAFNATLNGYLIPAGISSIAVPVNATGTGTATNVVAGGVNRLLTPISGVDYVSNAAAMTGGSSGETDAALRARFVLFIASLSRGTVPAVGYAITQAQLGIQYTITENLSPAGVAFPGYFYVVVDDGSGQPPTSLLNTVSSIVNTYRAASIQYSIISPQVLLANVYLNVSIASGFDQQTVFNAVSAAITSYIQNLGLGNTLSYMKLGQVAFNASPGVTDVTALSLNGGTADLVATSQITIKPGTVAVG